MTAQAQTSLEDIDKGWAKKPINNVVNGSLGIMLERFDQTWPTWMGTAIRDAMEKGESKVVLNEETELTVTIDSKNGYVEVSDAGTDGESMSACYWNRSNGHKLLAINDGYFRGEQAVMTESTGITFYKYDNATRKLNLTYEAELGVDINMPSGTTGVTYELPRQGKTMIINCHTAAGKTPNRYTWNGSKFVKEK